MDVQASKNIIGVFSEIDAQNHEQLKKQGLILETNFEINKTHEEYRLFLTNSRILASNQQINKNVSNNDNSKFFSVQLNFELKLEVIIQNNIKFISGFKLRYQKFQVYFFTANSGILLQWIQALSKKLNQNMFHQNFKPIRKLGKGSFASVYQVSRISDQKRMAVKAFSKSACLKSHLGMKSVVNEIQIMKKVNHQNIISIQNVYESDNSIYVVLQKLEGGQLHQYLNLSQNMSQKQLQIFMLGMFRGLQYLHNLRIIHRDIKPQNIMFRSKQSMDPVIVDFGLATNADEKYLFHRCGTIGYVAPEILDIKQNQQIQPQCDIFSLGVIFHYLLTKKNLFQGCKYEDVYVKNRNMDFKLEGQTYKKVGTFALDLLVKMLEKEPKKRIKASQALNHPFLHQKSPKRIGLTRKKIKPNQILPLQLLLNN